MKPQRVEEWWKNIQNIVKGTTREVCGKGEKKVRTPWFTEECQRMIAERKELKQLCIQNRNGNHKLQNKKAVIALLIGKQNKCSEDLKRLPKLRSKKNRRR